MKVYLIQFEDKFNHRPEIVGLTKTLQKAIEICKKEMGNSILYIEKYPNQWNDDKNGFVYWIKEMEVEE